jgi:hypothetical protein
MTRRTLLPALVLLCTALILAQSEDKEGRAWLEANRKAAPEINVTGIWQAADWGRIPLSQKEGRRTIIGSGDGWDISGVVSGKEVYLIFSSRGQVKFSAKLTAQGSGVLDGTYTSGILSDSSKTRPLRLSK